MLLVVIVVCAFVLVLKEKNGVGRNLAVGDDKHMDSHSSLLAASSYGDEDGDETSIDR